VNETGSICPIAAVDIEVLQFHLRPRNDCTYAVWGNFLPST